MNLQVAATLIIPHHTSPLRVACMSSMGVCTQSPIPPLPLYAVPLKLSSNQCSSNNQVEFVPYLLFTFTRVWFGTVWGVGPSDSVLSLCKQFLSPTACLLSQSWFIWRQRWMWGLHQFEERWSRLCFSLSPWQLRLSHELSGCDVLPELWSSLSPCVFSSSGSSLQSGILPSSTAPAAGGYPHTLH